MPAPGIDAVQRSGMKAILGLVSLLVVLGVLSLLAKKQLSPQPASTPQTPSQQVQQIRLQVEAEMQKPREMAEEK
ncbi:MAG: hypothetical protein ACOYNZ_20240 [Rhodoferax sp.]